MTPRDKKILAAFLLIGGALAYQNRNAIYNSLPSYAQQYLDDFMAADQNNGLPAGTTAKVAAIESNYNATAYNPSGATGIMQIVPGQHPGVDATNPQSSIAYAGKYLAYLVSRFGSLTTALAAYNWGEGNVSNAIATYGANWLSHAPPETQNYVAKFNAMGSLG